MMELCYLTANLLKIIVKDAGIFKNNQQPIKSLRKNNLLIFT